MLNQHIIGKWKVMKIVLTFCLALALLVGCGGEPNLDDPKVREKVLAEAIDQETLQTRRAPSGEELRYAPNQERPYAGWVKDGRELYQFQNGKPNGLYISWYSNKQNYQKGIRKDGKSTGLWTTWYENGQKREEGSYKDDIRDGLYISWYSNGQNYQKGTYKNGRIDGVWTEWDRNGQVLWTGNLDDPQVREKIPAEAIDADSFIDASERMYNQSPWGYKLLYVPNQERPYTGWLKSNSELYQFQNGSPRFYISWYGNGQKREEGTYKHGFRNGLWTEWYENGQKREEGTYIDNGQEDGLWTEWDRNGQVLWSGMKGGEENNGTLTPLNEVVTEQVD